MYRHENQIKASRTADEVQSSSAQIVASIDDLLKEILLRLPIKSLIRFKLVSKQWHYLISNPRFYSKGIRIAHSCNGLLLCSSFQARDNNQTYYVYNPTTNKFPILPKLDVGDGISPRIHGMSLAFDPAKSFHYKVVCVQGLRLDMVGYQYECEVYSSKTGSWRKCGEPLTAHVNFEDGVYWNGAIHWNNNGTGRDSLYFNIGNQMLRIMPIPPIDWDCINNYYFGESFDHLHYIKIVGLELHFDVYEMRRDYSEWFIKYNVDLHLLLVLILR
ncbi:hypothetical protein DH2020_048360 [Rehmannia glutinosa]|uniref:F-box domain-containing protein n=1 Tax=Rehmannia glutinosa TaxID=99300 RepID=A0ABR0U5V5_REHGL